MCVNYVLLGSFRTMWGNQDMYEAFLVSTWFLNESKKININCG